MSDDEIMDSDDLQSEGNNIPEDSESQEESHI
jgi:hypothetical protein